MISVLTPTVRPELLHLTERCLKMQTIQDYEWLVCSPKEPDYGKWVPQPPAREGDFYGLNKAFNALFREAKGDVALIICDSTWFPATTLLRVMTHFGEDPKRCVRGQGNQFLKLSNLSGVPEGLCWIDPLSGTNLMEAFPPLHMEFRLAALPMQAVRDCGGIEEDYDRVAAWSEKEMCCRLSDLGYNFVLDRGLEFRFVKHEEHGEAWEQKAQEAAQLMQRHCAELTLKLRQPRLTYL